MDTVIDIEANGLENATKIHCMVVDDADFASYEGIALYLELLNPEDRIIGHNFQRYDKPTLERILGIKIKAQIVDTLALSWYLYPELRKHGLEDWGVFFGYPKVPVSDWEGLSTEEYLVRCRQDVVINTMLWEKIQQDLLAIYETQEGVDHLIKYLSFKMECAELQESDLWSVDVEGATELLQELEKAHSVSTEALMGVMPKTPKTVWRKPPANPFNNDGTPSKHGLTWISRCEKAGVDTTVLKVKEQVGWDEPKPSSTVQIKKWLFDLGWKPATFIYQDDKAIPQVKFKEELCSSIKIMIAENPELKHLETLTIQKHRIEVLKALLEAQENGFVKAEIQGLTNTLRFKHRKPCANIPSLRKPYGKDIRSLFKARRADTELCGSDMASLEDRTKQHYLWDYDPDYVKDMQVPGFDPHLDLAESSGAVTTEQVFEYKAGHEEVISGIRHLYKGGNYACTYGSGVRGLARQLGIPQRAAAKIHKAYWDRNWSIKAVAANTITKNVQGKLWLWNPVSKLWYSLRHEKDIFSTLNQGTGVYCFDLWVYYVLQQRKQLTAQFHDEIILEVYKGRREETTKILKIAVQKVNAVLKLNRELDVDVKFGDNYAEIH